MCMPTDKKIPSSSGEKYNLKNVKKNLLIRSTNMGKKEQGRNNISVSTDLKVLFVLLT